MNVFYPLFRKQRINGNKGVRQKVNTPYLIDSFIVLTLMPNIKPGDLMLRRIPANVWGIMMLTSSTSTI